MTHDRRRRWVSGLLVLLVLAAGGVAVWSLSRYVGERTQMEEKVASGEIFVSQDLDGRRVVWDVAPEVDESRPVPSGGTVDAPEQGLSVPLVDVSLAGGVINPPTMLDAFRYREFGDPATPAPVRWSSPGTRCATGGPPATTSPPPAAACRSSLSSPETLSSSTASPTPSRRPSSRARTTSQPTAASGGRTRVAITTSRSSPAGTVGRATENVVVLAKRTD